MGALGEGLLGEEQQKQQERLPEDAMSGAEQGVEA